MEARLPQFCAASAFIAIVEAVVAVARPYPDASGSDLDILGESCCGNGEESRRSYCENVSSHVPPFDHCGLNFRGC